MNAIVEVTTAEVVVKTNSVTVITTVSAFSQVSAPVVVTSTLRSLTLLRYSIDAVAPNHISRKEPALAAA